MSYSNRFITPSFAAKALTTIPTGVITVGKQAIVLDDAKLYQVYSVFGRVAQDNGFAVNALQNAQVRHDLKILCQSNTLYHVLRSLFSASGRVHVKAPTYTSLQLMNEVRRKNPELHQDAIILYSSIVNAMMSKLELLLDLKNVDKLQRLDELKVMDNLFKSLATSALIDKIMVIVDRTAKQVVTAAKQVVIFSFEDAMTYGLREIAVAIDDVDYDDTMLSDVLQLVGAYLNNDRRFDLIYGELNTNDLIRAAAANVTVAKYAVSNYDKSSSISIPAHELRNVLDRFARLLGSHPYIKVVSSVTDLMQYSLYDDGSIYSAMHAIIVTSAPYSNPTTVLRVSGDLADDSYSLVHNVSDRFKQAMPKLTEQLVRSITLATMRMWDERAVFGVPVSKRKRRLVISNLHLSDYDLLLVQFAAMLGTSYSVTEGVLTYELKDKTLVSNLLGEQFISSWTDHVFLAALSNVKPSDELKFKMEVQDELSSIKTFYGIWSDVGINLASIDVEFATKYGDWTVNGVMPFFQEHKNYLSGKVVRFDTAAKRIINMIGEGFETSNDQDDTERFETVRAIWSRSVCNALLFWANSDASVRNMLRRAMNEASVKVQLVSDGNVTPDQVWGSPLFNGYILLSLTISILEVMAAEGLDPAVRAALISPANVVEATSLIANLEM